MSRKLRFSSINLPVALCILSWSGADSRSVYPAPPLTAVHAGASCGSKCAPLQQTDRENTFAQGEMDVAGQEEVKTTGGEVKKGDGDSFFLIQRGAEADGNRDWLPPAAVALNTAVGRNDLEAVKEMIDRGVDVNIRMVDTQQSPLMAAESARMVSLLLKAGADPRLVDSLGATALHYAVLKEKALAVIPPLLSAGADVNAVEPGGGETPFLWAKQWFFGMDTGMGERVLDLLLRKGADINAKDKFGDTLLHTAVMNRKAQLVKFLLDRGADPSIPNEEGRTPLDTARDLKFSEIESLLGQGARRPSR